MRLPCGAVIAVVYCLSIGYPNLAVAQPDCSNHFAYMNGVNTTSDMAEEDTTAIRHLISSECAASIDVDVSLAYNQTRRTRLDVVEDVPPLLDLLEACIQLSAENSTGNDVWRCWEWIEGVTAITLRSDPRVTLASLELTEAMVEDWEGSNRSQILEQVQDHLSNASQEIVVLAHSQGNLFANLVFDELDESQQTRYRVVAVATPSSRVAGNGPYTTFVGDPINWVPGSLDANRRNDSLCGGIEFACHYLVNSYLAHGESRRRIVNQLLNINDAPLATIEFTDPSLQFPWDTPEVTVYAYGSVNGAPAAMVMLSSRRSTDVDGRNHECSSEVELSCIRQVTWHTTGTSFLPVIGGGWSEAPETSIGPDLFRLYSVGSHQIDLTVEDFDGALATTPLLLHVRAAPSPGFIQFTSAQYSASEDTGTVHVVVERVGGSDGFVEAVISASGGTADTTDYEGLPQRVIFAPGDVSRIVSIAIVDDMSPESAETIGLSLTLVCSTSPCQPTGVLGAPSEASLTIADNDQASVPFTLLFSEGTQIVQMNLDGQVVRRLDMGRAVGYFDVSDDLSRIVYSDGASQIWTYEIATRESQPWRSAPWSQTLKWLPGSSTTFIHGASDGNLYSYNTSTRASTLWQSRDTAQVLGKNVYRGGMEFSDASSGRVIARIGVGGAGGDGVFVGDLCSVDASHHICNLRVVSNPAGTGTSWSSIAYGPSLTQDGRYAYYAERLNWNAHRVMRRDLNGGGAIVVYETTVGGDTGFGHTALFDNDQFLVFGDIYTNGDRAIRVCDLGAPAGTSCSARVLQTPGVFGGSIVVPVKWP